jgi:serine protease Do
MKTDLDAAFATIARDLRAATVRVHDAGGRGSGSGIVWDPQGLILTNAHVVRGGSATIEASDGTSLRARLVRRDRERDLAALRIEVPTGLPVPPRRDSQSVVPGELVVAVGNPLGFVGAVTAGLVHRCNARWVIADVRLAPGNSGGPLADAQGRIVGINSMVAGGLALAIPTAAVEAFLGERSERRLGVTLAPVRGSAPATQAFLILEIETGSVAERSGLMLGDTILRLRPHEFANAAALEILRGGVVSTVRLAWPGTPEHSRAA